MTISEKADLRELVAMLGAFDDKVTARFDAQDERLRSVENKVTAMQAVESERRESKVGIRWTWTTFLSILGISSASALGVIGIVLRVLGI